MDDRANAPICPWCGERLELHQMVAQTLTIPLLIPVELYCSSQACEYRISLIPEPAPVASGSVGRA